MTTRRRPWPRRRASRQTRSAAFAAEMAHVAFREEITLERSWTDAWGRKHDKMIGRPVSMHAMRGISAHSNGFQTCRMIHVLQILLGSIDCPGGFRYKPPYPKQTPPNLLPHGLPEEIQPEMPLGGPHLGFPHGPQHLLIGDDGAPSRLDKGFSWDAPMSAHGLMHMVLNNAAKRDPYGIDVLFLYMANMAWNSSMNVPGTLEALTATDENGDYVIPKIIYSDAYYSETVPLCRPDPAGHYLSGTVGLYLAARPADIRARHDRRRDPAAGGPARPRCARVPGRADRPWRAAGPSGFRQGGWQPRLSRRLPRLHGQPRAQAGYRGRSRGGAAKDGTETCVGAPNPDQLSRYIEDGAFHVQPVAPEHAYFKHANRGYLDWGIEKGIRLSPEPTIFQLYCETAAALPAGRAGPWRPPAARARP